MPALAHAVQHFRATDQKPRIYTKRPAEETQNHLDWEGPAFKTCANAAVVCKDVDLAGKQLTLSPHVLAALGLIYTSREGFFASASVNYIGYRFLDLANAAPTTAYTTFDSSIGYRFGRYNFSLNGYNLTNRRPPVTQSEFGDLSYYLLPARTIFFNLTASLD